MYKFFSQRGTFYFALPCVNKEKKWLWNVVYYLKAMEGDTYSSVAAFRQ